MPRPGFSVVEMCLPFHCDCSHYLFELLLCCMHSKHHTSHSLLIDCGGSFLVSKFVAYIENRIPNPTTSSGLGSKGLLEELLSRLHVIRVFTHRELTLALYASRDVLSRRPISFIFFNNINAFGDLENLTAHPKKKATAEQILWCGMLQRLLRDFNLLCISIRRCVPRLNCRQQSKGCDSVQSNFPVSASFPFYQESMSSNWVNCLTHRIEIISCQSQYVSYVKRDSTFQVAIDKR